MKKKWFKKLLSAGLVLVLTLGLCACGSTEGDGSGTGGNGGGIGSLLGNKDDNKSNPNAALAKQYVYTFTEYELPEIECDNITFQGSLYKDGRLYMVMQVFDWEVGNDYDIRILSMNADGSDMKMTPLEIPDAKKNENASSDLDGGASTLPMPRTEGEAKTEESTDDTVDVPVEEPLPDVNLNVYESSHYNNYKFGSDGKIYAVKNYYYEDYSDPDNYVYEQHNYICSWDADGKYLWEVEVEGLQSDEEWLYVSQMVITDDGAVNLILSGDNSYKLVVKDGAASEKQPLPDDITKVFMNAGSIATKADGTLVVTYYDENDWTKMMVVSYDMAANTLGEAKALPASLVMSGYYTLEAGVNSDFIYATNDGVFSINGGDEQPKQMMSYINSDMSVEYFEDLIELDDKNFVGVFFEGEEYELTIGKFTYKDPSEIKDKSVLVLGGSYVDYDLKNRVIEFNRASEEYRIVIKEYESYNTYDDYQAGYKQLNNDIITGNMPDILITEGLPVENYISKGLLVDIGALIAGDEELSKVEFVQNVFDAYSVGGKLYYVIPQFSVNTMIGKSSIVGDKTGWTMAEVKELMATLPEGTQMFGDVTREYFINMIMQYCGSEFVDVETGKCAFNTPNFIEMMEFAKTLPEEIGEDHYDEDYWINYESQYRDNRTILSSMYISNIRNTNYTINGNFGEDVSYVGFPTQSGMGSYISAYSSYAISSRSNFADVAWDFIKYYLTDEYQSEITWGLPVQKERFMELAQEATNRPYYLDEDGNKVEYDDYFWMNNESIVLPPLSQEQVDEMVNFIFSVNKTYYSNTEIVNIVNEEIDAFFTGQKTAQAVADVIQSRAQIYVDENR